MALRRFSTKHVVPHKHYKKYAQKITLQQIPLPVNKSKIHTDTVYGNVALVRWVKNGENNIKIDNYYNNYNNNHYYFIIE